MSTKSKRLMSLLLAMGLCLIVPEALAWSWNQYQPRPYNGFESYSPGYGPSGYGYQPAYPGGYRGAYRPRYYGYGYQPAYPRGYRGAYRPRYYGYGHGRHYYQRPRCGHYRYFPNYRNFPGRRY